MPLISWYYGNIFDERWGSFSGIILSTVLLVYSLTSNKADYSNRIAKIQSALGESKRLKRELGNLISTRLESDITESDEFKSIKSKYETMISAVEPREDIDFFWTVRQNANRVGISYFNSKEKKTKTVNWNDPEADELLRYISELSPRTMWVKYIFVKVIHIALYIIPVIIIFTGFWINYVGGSLSCRILK